MSVNRGEYRNHIRQPDADKKIFVSTNSYCALFVTRPVSGLSLDQKWYTVWSIVRRSGRPTSFFHDYLSIQVSLRLIKWHTYIHTNGV